MNDPTDEASKPAWRPLSAVDRRVLGTLAEKARTTPDSYPLSLNALRVGCSQKSNRDPVMELNESQVEESIERLRGFGAAAVVHGGGRVEKFRHYLYEWLGTKDKLEQAVMIELLLRGAQTEGELRGRASRIEPISDLTTLRRVLDALREKGLVVSLSPEGRGHVVTHTLYEPREMERLVQRHASAAESVPSPAAVGPAPSPAPSGPSPTSQPSPGPSSSAAVPAPPAISPDALAALTRELSDLQASHAQLRSDFDSLSSQFTTALDDLRRLHDALGG